MYQIADTTVRGREIQLSDEQHVYIGHNALLDGCQVHFRIRRKNGITVANSRFVDCHLFADRPLKGVNWTSCHLANCTFHGRFENCALGYWPEHFNMREEGSINKCDLGDAELHLCEFYGCDMSSLVLPRWPCFTLLQPREFFASIRQLSEPPSWLAYWDKIDGELSRMPDFKAVAVSYHAPTFAKWLSENVYVTEVEMREFLKDRANVVL